MHKAISLKKEKVFQACQFVYLFPAQLRKRVTLLQNVDFTDANHVLSVRGEASLDQYKQKRFRMINKDAADIANVPEETGVEIGIRLLMLLSSVDGKLCPIHANPTRVTCTNTNPKKSTLRSYGFDFHTLDFIGKEFLILYKKRFRIRWLSTLLPQFVRNNHFQPQNNI
uniref:Uncharacterized protein n=1 Tax=Candidatus Kentrum sp. LPFa TaxID=2126335 RepID=A0A450WGB1_9GAMM|nr:MAG: hypothetical protein BECKLPF1236B_GA0070989_10882 [Candidatus Kentron sp. LPFa]